MYRMVREMVKRHGARLSGKPEMLFLTVSDISPILRGEEFARCQPGTAMKERRVDPRSSSVRFNIPKRGG